MLRLLRVGCLSVGGGGGHEDAAREVDMLLKRIVWPAWKEV